MTAARLTAAELGAFPRTELPHMFDDDDLTIAHVTATYSIPNTWCFSRSYNTVFPSYCF
jgi:hypothetical protein